MDWVPAISRWLHFLSGVMWIGLLYYFNFVQAAALKAATADGTAAGITKHVAPRALLYFRWAAVVTWLSGAALLGNQFVPGCLARDHHADQRMGADLAQSAKNSRPQARYRRGKSHGAPGRVSYLARQHHVVDSAVVFHGGRLVASRDLRSLVRQAAALGHPR